MEVVIGGGEGEGRWGTTRDDDGGDGRVLLLVGLFLDV